MALQSEVSPPLVGDPNKDTQIEGDTKSEDSSQSTDEDVDLEEGEILDSGAEEEEKKDLGNSSLKEALDLKCLKSIEQLVSQAKATVSTPNALNKNVSPHNSPLKVKKRPRKEYLDHDRFENNSDQEDGWYSPSRNHKTSKFDNKPIDYRKELEAYRGTPPSSPDSSKHREKRKKRSSKKSKKSSKKAIKRKDIKGVRVSKYLKDAMRNKMCKFFKEGNCAKGSDCGFSHSSPQPYKKKELCKFYLSGHCNKGNDCLYMHGEFPCKFYHTGSECYAKDACRFSHSPLTEETKRILADYLNINHGDEDFDRKRRRSPTPEPKGPPPKRTCLLGSPPRHIREAEETKRWQEEMLMQQQNHPGFKIHLSPSRESSSSPPPFTKPNFYQETLPSTPSPKKRRANPESTNTSLSTSFPPPPHSSAGAFPLSDDIEPYPQRSPDERFVYEEDYQDMDDLNIKQEQREFSWTDMRGIGHPLPPVKNEMEQFVDPAQQDLDFTSDVKFDETTQFSEMESSVDCNVPSPPPPNSTTPAVTITTKDSEEESSNQEAVIKSEDKTNDDASSVPEPVAAPPPIVVPSHLPKKQQELLKRIYQHQKKNALAASISDASNSPKSSDNNTETPPVKEAEEPVEKSSETERSDSLWYSSEDDEDDDDSVDQLTDVLKKLQKEPPANPPPKVESKPAAASIMAMLNKVQQNTIEKNKGTSETHQSDFFTNLILGNIPSTESLQLPGLNLSANEPKRRTLLPDPQPVVKKEPVVAPKDPRLKNRDPRTLTSTVNNLPLSNSIELPVSQATSRELKTTVFSSTTDTVISASPKEDIPYKLHGIYTKPPNYTPYLDATQSNPNLLKDPRIRKHLNRSQSNENGVDNKKDTEFAKIPPKIVPPMPKLLLEYDKPLNINIFESNPVSKPVTEAQSIKPPLLRPKLSDPRMRRRDSQNSSGSNTPPHLTIIENSLPSSNKIQSNFENETQLADNKKWSPPILEKSWNPPVLEASWNAPVKQELDDSDGDDPTRLEIDESPDSSSINASKEDASPVIKSKVKPTPASHLPRAIADPRMAKLHNPLDSRRLRVSTPECSNKNVELKKGNSAPNENSVDSSKTAPSNSLESESVKSSKTIPKKSSDKSDEKKKIIHRNRKSSLDYASPLNSCDDSNSSKSLNYNSYNQRPVRTAASFPVSDSSVSSNSTNSIVPETTTTDFFSDNSNLECDNSNDVNLKDMFKTIDPTASPFC